MLKQTDLAGKTDAELDAMYAAAFDAGNSDATVIGFEIVDRLQSVSSFISGFFGAKKFPLYDARGAFHQVSEAQTSVAESAKTVATNVADSVSGWSKGILIVVALVAIAYLVFKFKK